MIMTPEKMPAPPNPAIARPRMKAMEFGAAPHITEPISKTATVNKKVLADRDRSAMVILKLLQ